MNWRFTKYRIWWAIYGLTHIRCRQCGAPKELSLRRNCYSCGLKNIMTALETEPK
jgi:hypothetical protein